MVHLGKAAIPPRVAVMRIERVHMGNLYTVNQHPNSQYSDFSSRKAQTPGPKIKKKECVVFSSSEIAQV